MKAHLKGEAPPLSAAQLGDLLEVSGAAVREAIAVERATDSYWLAQYFAAAPRGSAWPGQLVAWARQETGTGLQNTLNTAFALLVKPASAQR